MATFEHVKDTATVTRTYRGSWTAETSAADHTIHFPHHVAMILVQLDSGGTSPNWLVKFADDSDETTLITGTTGVFTSPTDATGITLTNRSNGTCDVKVDANSMTASGTNQWIAWCEIKGI